MKELMEHWSGEQEANEHYVIGTEISQAEKPCSAPVAHQLDLNHQR
jgi:hypothetical protein